MNPRPPSPAVSFAELTPLPGRVRLSTLVLLRWLGIAGQLVAIFIVNLGLGYPLPFLACLAVIGLSAIVNISASLRHPSIKRLGAKETAAYLAFDLIQLSALLALTGGLENPFALLIIAPVVTSATTLTPRATIALMILSLLAITLLAFFHWPLPWHAGTPGTTPVLEDGRFRLPVIYVVGIYFALVLGIGFTTIYIWRIASEAKRMSDALAATQSVLAREQRISALGGLAAAAAHELGTPLATIALVAKELRRELPENGPMAEDMTLLASQVERCREILGRLSVRPEEGERHMEEASLGALLDEVVSPHRGFDIDIEIRIASEPGRQPSVRRAPELLHALGNLVENSVDFARSRVTLEASWNEDNVSVIVSDDGPGFSPEIFDRLGEPYVTSRGARTGQALQEDEHQGMGLGFFIANTLIERIGGTLRFANRGGAGGASVTVVWPRNMAPQFPAGPEA